MRAEEKAEIIMRLRSAEGHLRAVIGKMESNEPCEQVLHQLGAVRAALRAAGARLVDCQINSCEEVIRHNSNPEKRATELTRLIDLYYLLDDWPKEISQNPER